MRPALLGALLLAACTGGSGVAPVPVPLPPTVRVETVTVTVRLPAPSPITLPAVHDTTIVRTPAPPPVVVVETLTVRPPPLPPVTHYDTVTITLPPLPPIVRTVVETVTVRPAAVHDTTVLVWSPQTNAARDSVLWFGPFPWPGARPTNFAIPRPAARTDTVPTPSPVVIAPPPVVVPPVVTPTIPPPGNALAPELPRDMDRVVTAMPDLPMSGDTLYLVGAVWWCRGPTCDATRASHNLPAQPGPPPPIPTGIPIMLPPKS